jgi:hypothetical protein
MEIVLPAKVNHLYYPVGMRHLSDLVSHVRQIHLQNMLTPLLWLAGTTSTQPQLHSAPPDHRRLLNGKPFCTSTVVYQSLIVDSA